MKRLWLLVLIAMPLLATSAQAASDSVVVITGSHIPKKVKRVGDTSASIAPILTIDRTAIDRSGATTVAGVVRMVPFAQVRGR